MPGTWAHLARRFFWSLGARDLSPPELAEIEAVLTPDQFAMFVQQSPTDRRHGYDAARTVMAADGDSEVIRAAACHDIGKRHARLGVIGRSVASVCGRLGLPAPGRLGTYLRHAEIGADELAAAGASDLVVTFTRHHHGTRPAGFDPAVWELLVRADTEVIGRAPHAG